MNCATEGIEAKASSDSRPRLSRSSAKERPAIFSWIWWICSKTGAASAAGTKSPALRSKRRTPRLSSVCLTSRLIPGGETLRNSAAPWIVPVIITARMTSTCRSVRSRMVGELPTP